MRPADGVETAECWQLALEHAHRPSLLAFSRQDVPTVRINHTPENLSAKGAYELVGEAGAKVTFLATGSEVGIAMDAREMLAKEGIASRIVSMPCWALFEEQSEQYREQVLGTGTVKIAIEAAVQQGWDRYIGATGRFIGMHSFGSSGPAKDVYRHFHISPEAAVEAAKKALSKS
jgi:transketolase